MNILYLAPDLPPVIGGMQTHAFEIIRRLSEENEVAVACGAYAAGSKIGKAKLFPFLSGYRVTRRSLSFFADTVQKLSPDLVHILSATHAPFARVVKSVRDIPVVVTCHGKDFLDPWTVYPGAGGIRERVREGIGVCDRVIAVSRYNRGKLLALGFKRHKIDVIFNGVDTRIFFPRRTAHRIRGLESRGPVLFTASRIDGRKGLGTVLRAFSLLLKKFPSCRLVIAGGMSVVTDAVFYRKLLLPFLRQEGIEERVVYVGTVGDPGLLAKYYNACDLFIMVPRMESFGIVYLEANACGKPVVASRTGGISDAVVDGVTGLMVRPDDVAGTARALIRLFSDRVLRAKLGKQGWMRVRKEFEWNKIAYQTVGVYKEVVRKRALQEGSERI